MVAEAFVTAGAVLVTGANSGIGAAIVRRLAVPGARIAVHFLNEEQSTDACSHTILGRQSAEALATELEGSGATIALFDADLRDPVQAEGLIGRVSRRAKAISGRLTE